jgi:hypothetical protein
MSEAATVQKNPDSTAAPPAMERLRTYLSGLPDAAKQLLSAEITKARARGEDVPGGDLILAALGIPAPPVSRPADAAPAERPDATPRFLFRPLDPFLIDERLETKVRGRIMRASLPAIWTYFKRELQPEPMAELERVARAAEASGDEAPVASAIAAALPTLAAEAQAALDRAASSEQEKKRLTVRLGDDRVKEDLVDILAILAEAQVITGSVTKAPNAIKNLADEGLANARAMLEPIATHRPKALPYCLALFQNRLMQRAQLVRLAVAVAESDDPVKVAATPWKAAVDLVIGDIERATQRISRALKESDIERAQAGIKEFHDSIRSLRTDMSLIGDGIWQKRLGKLRADLSGLLSAQIDGLAGEVRRVLRLRQKSDHPMAPLSEETVQEIEAKLDLLVCCRNHASEIALNEITTRVFSEIQGYLDPTLTQLMDSIRAAPDTDRELKISQIEAAVRFSARIFGQSYAQLLQKAADVAIASGKAQR